MKGGGGFHFHPSPSLVRLCAPYCYCQWVAVHDRPLGVAPNVSPTKVRWVPPPPRLVAALEQLPMSGSTISPVFRGMHAGKGGNLSVASTFPSFVFYKGLGALLGYNTPALHPDPSNLGLLPHIFQIKCCCAHKMQLLLWATETHQ